MSCKEEFIEIFKENITREGADRLLDYLEHKSDFFTAPASARYHGAYEGGLCEHSLNVYHCLVDYLQRERVQEQGRQAREQTEKVAETVVTNEKMVSGSEARSSKKLPRNKLST